MAEARIGDLGPETGRERPIEPPVRDEFEVTVDDAGHVGDVARPLSTWEMIQNITFLRRAAILIALALIWQLYATYLDNRLMLPTFWAMGKALVASFVADDLLLKAWVSISTLLKGYVIGIVIAMVLTSLAVSTRIGNDLLSTLTSMFNPLPAIALLPIAMLWFGLGEASLIFVLIHAVLWPLALNTHSGFMAVSDTLRMAGRNYGLSGVRYVIHILIPAAFPSILAGLKIAWAFAWRTLIAAELVFGASSGSGGLGWYIFQNRNELLIDKVFAGLAMVIMIGLLIENVVFRWIEARTVQKWGMQRQ